MVGVKKYDFIDWCKIHKLMSEGSHLTLEGVNLNLQLIGGQKLPRFALKTAAHNI